MGVGSFLRGGRLGGPLGFDLTSSKFGASTATFERSSNVAISGTESDPDLTFFEEEVESFRFAGLVFLSFSSFLPLRELMNFGFPNRLDPLVPRSDVASAIASSLTLCNSSTSTEGSVCMILGTGSTVKSSGGSDSLSSSRSSDLLSPLICGLKFE